MWIAAQFCLDWSEKKNPKSICFDVVLWKNKPQTELSSLIQSAQKLLICSILL